MAEQVLAGAPAERVERPSRRQLKSLARDYALEYLDEHPEASQGEVAAAVEARIREDFPWSELLELLLKFLNELLPLLFALKKRA